MEPEQLQQLIAMLRAQQGGGMQSQPGYAGGMINPMEAMQAESMTRPPMGVPPGRFGPGQSAQAPMPVDQIPGMPPAQPEQPSSPMDELRRKFMSGGAMDLRNLGMAMGPAAQAAGGMGRAMQAGQQMGMPAKAQGMPPVERMFDMAQQAPRMGPGASQAGRGLPMALGATAGAGYGGYKAITTVDEMLAERERRMQELMKQMR